MLGNALTSSASVLTERRMRSVIVAIAVALVAVVSAVLALGHNGTAAAGAASANVKSTSAVSSMSMPPEAMRQWRALTDTPEKRAQVVKALEESFAGVATVGTTTRDHSTTTQAGGAQVQQVLAYGYDGGHVWLTASYADVAAGAVWVGVRYCSTRLPSALCNWLGNVLVSLARGWGWASNHGVWGALYWNGRLDTGRW